MKTSSKIPGAQEVEVSKREEVAEMKYAKEAYQREIS